MDLIEQIFTKRQHCFNYNLWPRWQAMHTHKLSQTSAGSPGSLGPHSTSIHGLTVPANLSAGPAAGLWLPHPPLGFLWFLMEERQDPLTLLELWVWVLSPHLPPSFGQRIGSLHPSALGLKSVSPTPMHPSIEPATTIFFPPASVIQNGPAILYPDWSSYLVSQPPPPMAWPHLPPWSAQTGCSVWHFAGGGTPISRGVSLGCRPSFTSFPTSSSWNLPPELPQGQTPGMEILSRPQQDWDTGRPIPAPVMRRGLWRRAGWGFGIQRSKEYQDRRNLSSNQ